MFRKEVIRPTQLTGLSLLVLSMPLHKQAPESFAKIAIVVPVHRPVTVTKVIEPALNRAIDATNYLHPPRRRSHHPAVVRRTAVHRSSHDHGGSRNSVHGTGCRRLALSRGPRPDTLVFLRTPTLTGYSVMVPKRSLPFTPAISGMQLLRQCPECNRVAFRIYRGLWRFNLLSSLNLRETRYALPDFIS